MTPAVDSAARRRAALLLRRLVSGRIASDAFEAAMPDSRDPAIGAIWQSAWCFYSDGAPELSGRHALHPIERRECLRWILFLDSDRPYVWPRHRLPAFRPLPDSTRRVSLFGGRRRARAFLGAGDYRAWPFACPGDEAAARRHPRRLAGRPGQARAAH
ncbi:hypothetical protein GE300_12475 [Rhodobacteraceae bacterium 2CG4]|uniref:Uncharacterized protein n=1 Tax=Halovulum marinum TaxID=2662447 RepID=A0A6L5Z1I2_9RHOB|nr:hypothetical protein [Halovulum marinum]MSU90423.1 hypothetical protein [Halovulum marinum]